MPESLFYVSFQARTKISSDYIHDWEAFCFHFFRLQSTWFALIDSNETAQES